MQIRRDRDRRALGATRIAVALSFAMTLHAQTTQRASVASSGAQGNDESDRPSISADGRFVAFESRASNLVAAPDATFFATDVFVRDLQFATTELISVDGLGTQANDASYGPSISADGRFVAFTTLGSNLVAGDGFHSQDVFVRDRVGGTTELVSIAVNGLPGSGESSDASISADGRFVAFASSSPLLVPNDTNGALDVFVRDRQTGTTQRVSTPSFGGQSVGISRFTSISADGRYVCFSSWATNLVPNDTNGAVDVFVHDRTSQTTERVSVTTAGIESDGTSWRGALSADGSRVVFESLAANLSLSDLNGTWDVFVRDRAASTTELVSSTITGAAGGGSTASISPDGRFAAFASDASDLIGGDTNLASDTFVRDLLNGTTVRASVSAAGAQSAGVSSGSALSSGALRVAFSSLSADLVAGDSNGSRDVFVRASGDVVDFCAGDGLDPTVTTPCPCGNAGTTGRGCGSSAVAAGAWLSWSGHPTADDLALHAGALPASTTCVFLQGDALADATFGDGVSCTGGALVRLRVRAANAGAASFPAPGDTVTLSARGNIVPGSGAVRVYQTYYRNAAVFCTSATFNVTSAVRVVW